MKEIIELPITHLQNTLFEKRRCYFKKARTLKIEWNRAMNTYTFYGPLTILQRPQKEIYTFFKYWERRVQKTKATETQKKAERLLFHSLQQQSQKCIPSGRYNFNPQGTHVNLNELFNELQKFIQIEEKEIKLGWSKKYVRSYWGKYLPSQSSIIINKALDNPHVPKRIILFVLYHEYLHHILGFNWNEEQYQHHSEFKQFIKLFPNAEKIEKELKQLAGKRFMVNQ